MSVENFINFFIVNGFFIGLLFSILKVDNPEEIVIYTIIVTLSFYIIALFSSSLFLKFFNFKESALQKEAYDDILDHYIGEIEKREKVASSIFEFFEEYQKDEDVQREKDKDDMKKKIKDLQK